MASRTGGKPVALRDVLWAGKEPISAYVFGFTSRGRRYRCVTPKPCSNFFLEELGAPSLVLDCSAPASALAGRPVKVSFTLRNGGNAVEPKVAVRLPVPAGAEYIDPAAGTRVAARELNWEIRDLPPGEARLLGGTFVLSRPGVLPFALSARGDLAGPVESQCSTKVEGIAAILLEVVDLDDPIQVGTEVTYLIKVINQGSAPGTRIQIKCLVPTEQEFISGTGTTRVAAQAGTVTMEVLPELAPKAEAAWRVTVKAVTAGDVRFLVHLSSDQFQQPIVEEEPTHQY